MSLQSVVVEQGTDVLINVTVDANPAATIVWLFNGQQLELNDKFSLQEDTVSLSIVGSAMEDSGNWTIVANNGIDAETRLNVKLEVTPPRIPVEVSYSIQR